MKVLPLLAAGILSPQLLTAGTEDNFGKSPITGVVKHGVGRWRFGAGAAPLLNVSANFSNLGAFSNPLVVPAMVGTIDRTYDNGYVFVDSSGNAGGKRGTGDTRTRRNMTLPAAALWISALRTASEMAANGRRKTLLRGVRFSDTMK